MDARRRLRATALAILNLHVANHLERGHTQTMSNQALDYDSIPVLERIRLVEDIWDSIASSSEQVPVTDAQRAELDCRRQAHESDPQPPVDWADARARISEKVRNCR